VQAARCHSMAGIASREKGRGSRGSGAERQSRAGRADQSRPEQTRTDAPTPSTSKQASKPHAAARDAAVYTFRALLQLASCNSPSSLLTPGSKYSVRVSAHGQDQPSQANVDRSVHWDECEGARTAQRDSAPHHHLQHPRYAPQTTYLWYLCRIFAALDSPSLPNPRRIAARRPLPPPSSTSCCCCCCLPPTGSFSYTTTHSEPTPSSIQPRPAPGPDSSLPFSLDPHQHLWACLLACLPVPLLGVRCQLLSLITNVQDR
jgi:hypothetical protein